MNISNEKNKTTIEKMKREIEAEIARDAIKSSSDEVNFTDLDNSMLKLLNIDAMIQSMRFFTRKNTPQSPKEYSTSLDNFIISYKSSAYKIYGDEKDLELSKKLEDIRRNIRISTNFSSYKDLDSITEAIPSANLYVLETNKNLMEIDEYEKQIEELKASIGSGKTTKKEEKDIEAQEVLSKMVERVKKKSRSTTISGFSYGKDEIIISLIINKENSKSLVRNSLFDPLNTPEGVERLNNELEKQNNQKEVKSAKKSDNKKTLQEIKDLEEKIKDKNLILDKLRDNIGEETEKHFKTLSDKELLDAFVTKKSNKLNEVFANCCNFDRLQKNLVQNFEKDKEIWKYVEDAEYYELIKDVVRAGTNNDRFNKDLPKYKESIIYQAMSKPLKDMINIREVELYGLRDPSKESIEEMNELLEKQGYRIRLQKVTISKEKKPDEFKDKNNFEVARTILSNATKIKDGENLSSYDIRNMETGIMCCLGEGTNKEMDSKLFKNYMLTYFNKKDFSKDKEEKLRKQYAWEEYKTENKEIARDIYKDIKENSSDPEKLKEGLLIGRWETDVVSNHHDLPRKFGFTLANPDDLNNAPNISKTATWKAWDEDPHRMEHFFSMAQDDGVYPYLAKVDGEYVRVSETDGLEELYYEKPQILKDREWVDLIPNNTLIITPNITIKSPKLPDRVKHLARDCFKDIPDLDTGKKNIELDKKVFDVLKKKREKDLVSM